MDGGLAMSSVSVVMTSAFVLAVAAGSHEGQSSGPDTYGSCMNVHRRPKGQAPVDTHVMHGRARYVLALTIWPELSMRRRFV